jgi:hypothetical protein
MQNRMTKLLIAPTLAAALLTACGTSQSEATEQSITTTQVKVDVWVDNWFALYVNEELVKEDSVAFKTERSFNAESFTFPAKLPVQVAVIMKDYYENDTGLEYIGQRGQQIGDGGFIAQFKNAETGELIAASTSDWQCHAIHQAPLNTSCERSTDPTTECQSLITDEPSGWMSADFDDSAWEPATEHSSNAVRPKRDYQRISWDSNAKFIWTNDLAVDNIVLCRFTLDEA